MSGPIRPTVAEFILDDTFTAGDITGALFEAPVDGFIDDIYVYAGTGPVTVTGKINYTKDGGSPVLSSGERPTLTLGDPSSGASTGLNKSITRGQMIQMTLEQAVEAVGNPLRLTVYMRESRDDFRGIVSISSDLTLIPSEHFAVLVSASGAARTITLPSITGNDAYDIADSGIRRGQMHIIQKTDSSANTVTIQPDGAEQLTEAGTNVATITLTTQGETVIIQAGSSRWQVLVRKPTNAQLLSRANHTGTQTASTISDFSQAVDDRVGVLIQDSGSIDFTYDAGNALTGQIKASLPILSTSADLTLAVATHYTVLVDATGANRTITLPALSAAYNGTTGRGYIFNVQKIDATANTVTVDGDGSETINGATTKVLAAQYESMQIQAGPAEWSIL